MLEIGIFLPLVLSNQQLLSVGYAEHKKLATWSKIAVACCKIAQGSNVVQSKKPKASRNKTASVVEEIVAARHATPGPSRPNNYAKKMMCSETTQL
jgi:hypothetical protein